jgi:Flp pilus assembly protein TadD
VQIVALRVTQTTQPLASALTGDADWALVYVDAWHGLWLRRTGPNAELALSAAITEASLDTADHLRRLAGQDPVNSYAYHLGGTTLSHIGWYTTAIDVLAAAVQANPHRFDGWVTKGICHARRGTVRLARGRDGGADDLAEAEACFRKALELRPGLTDARRNLDMVRRQQADLERGLLWQP